jgi:23S rRNA (guanosine2251-2'-O)-methyltransferase
MKEKNMTFGLHAVASLLQQQAQTIISLHINQDRHDDKLAALVQQAMTLDLPINYLKRAQLDALCPYNHQGVVALITERPSLNEAALLDKLAALDKPAALLVLDGVQDPHNLGACLRSAEAFAVDAVIVPKDKSAQITPVVEKVACGAAALVPFVRVTNLARTLKALAKAGIWLVGLDGQTQSRLSDIDLSVPCALVMGGEGAGLRRLTRERCDYLAKIPMPGTMESLNVSVAAGVSLYELMRQRGSS